MCSSDLLEERVLSASPEQLQAMLYEAAIRFAQLGRSRLEQRDLAGASDALGRADAVLQELLAGLRPEVDPTLCRSFGALYQFCVRKLEDARRTAEVEPINDALLILDHLRRTWLMVCEKLAESAEVAAGV